MKRSLLRTRDRLLLGRECNCKDETVKMHKLRYKGVNYRMDFGIPEWYEVQFAVMTYKNTVNLHLDEIYEMGGEKWREI